RDLRDLTGYRCRGGDAELGRLCHRFVLDVGSPSVETREKNEKYRGHQHDNGEEEKIARAIELHRPVLILHKKIHGSGEYVSQRDCAQVRAHHERFQFFWGLSISKLQMG